MTEEKADTGVGLVTTELAELPPETFLDQEALSRVFSVSRSTLRRMIVRFELPPGVKLGGRLVWNVGEVRQYLLERAREAARKAERVKPRFDRVLGR